MPPKKAASTRKTYHYSVWVDPDQRADIDAAAAAAGEDNPSTWLRKLALRSARGERDAPEPAPKKKGGGR